MKKNIRKVFLIDEEMQNQILEIQKFFEDKLDSELTEAFVLRKAVKQLHIATVKAD